MVNSCDIIPKLTKIRNTKKEEKGTYTKAIALRTHNAISIINTIHKTHYSSWADAFIHM